jgi:ferredoxin
MNMTLDSLYSALTDKGYIVIAPVKENDKVFFRKISSPEQITLDYLNTILPAKALFFPKSETILNYGNPQTGEIEITSPDIADEKMAIIGLRPCDAKSLSILDALFNWDTKDEFYIKRREETLLAVHGCSSMGDKCFCDKLGLPYNSSAEADLYIESKEGNISISASSEKGKSVLPDAPQMSLESDKASGTMDLDKIKKWLDGNFDHEMWNRISMKCLGCGTCSYSCPTCHCFDIIDETVQGKGERKRNWDSCGFGEFTLHGSGHNPRPNQAARYRNRIM